MMWKIIIFKDKRNSYRWHLKAPNGRLIACSGESFDSRYNALRSARNFHRRTNQAAICLDG